MLICIPNMYTTFHLNRRDLLKYNHINGSIKIEAYKTKKESKRTVKSGSDDNAVEAKGQQTTEATKINNKCQKENEQYMQEKEQ